ncbi:uncharacterized protein RCC_10114 [Ramularia collo-cygni]|uniref:Protein kinase domain-containing protein n=1 Tax=Ramularia collo-cygni TaxID=112498 RepID=A0A2D3VLD6_9PEZI|nr:uncharacterized protein RCC_10114 [Ramularia collo-cygni]CZT24389.1 uncharacterized protein RCC_10114 [Ramularia collo-cygni]
MQHDIYSLGVCLLEIGLWSSFVKYGDGDVVLGPGDVLGLTSSDLCQATPISMKHHLVELAKSRLPAALGNVYTEVVLSCLTCLDADSEDFEEIGDDEDVDGVFVGVKFIERVLFKLNEINV